MRRCGWRVPAVARGVCLPAPAANIAAQAAGAAAVPADTGGIHEAPFLCVLAPCLTAAGCIALFFLADPIYRLLAPIAMR